MGTFPPTPQQTSDSAISWFREASPYIKAHHGRTLVMCLPDQMRANRLLTTLSHDITLLSHLGLRLVLCFGLRTQVNAKLKQTQESSRIIDGRRITDDAALQAILTAAGMARSEYEARLSRGLPNTPMAGARVSLCSGNFVTAQPFGIHNGVDYQHTGSVREVHRDSIKAMLDTQNVVLLPPIGYSLTGEAFNLQAEEVAAATAMALSADKLIFFVSELPTDEAGQPVRQASARILDRLAAIQNNASLSRTMTRAVDACRGGVERVHLLIEDDPNALLSELFTRDGSGSLVTAERWENSRTASIEDVGGIIALVKPLQDNGTLATRSREQLELDIENFVVCERDGMVVACAALYMSSTESDDESASAEIACVVTHPDYRGEGRAERLITQLENKARDAQFKRVLLLSTRTGHWFVERGYAETSLDKLPASRQSSYNRQRNSKLFVKAL